MNLLYIGAGFVGACSAAVSADSGHTVLVYDIDDTKIQMLGSRDRDRIESCLYEKGLGDLLIRNKERIQFTTNYDAVIACLDTVHAIFMCLPTPEIGETGESDLKYYTASLETLAPHLAARNNGEQSKYLVIVNKSTVPIDTVDHTKRILDTHGVKGVGVVSNPEFLVEGKAIEGALKPDRVVVGAWGQQDLAVMRKVYQRFVDASDVQYIEVNPKEAAAGKLLANFYLFNKLQICFDVIGRTAEAFTDIQFEALRKIITTDERIGNWGFYDSLYAGGSCFIKDARSLAHQLQLQGKDATMVSETYLANKRQLETFFARAEREAQFNWAGKTVALLGTAFKRDTNDVRNSASIELVRYMQEKNVGTIRVYDPSALPMFQDIFPASDTIQYVGHEFEAMQGADVIIIATDWPQFRGLADVIIAELPQKPLIMDGRRMLQHRYLDLAAVGCDILAVGSPFIQGKTLN
jgi:UDPglucose 6-dehydrogenase